MGNHRQNHPDLKAERKAIYDFFENKGFIFEEGSKSYLSEAIKNYSAKHHEILISQMRFLQDAIARRETKK